MTDEIGGSFAVSLAPSHYDPLFIAFILQELHDRPKRYAAIVIAILAASSVVALFLSSRLRRFISDPILDLAQTMQTVSRTGNSAVRAGGKAQPR